MRRLVSIPALLLLAPLLVLTIPIWVPLTLVVDLCTAPRRLHLVEVRALGPRHRVVLMRVDDREVLIGVSPGQISVLDRWTAAAQSHPAAAELGTAAAERP